MNNFQIFLLKALRKAYARCLGGYKLPPLQRETNPDKVSEMIYNLLTDDKPCMIARFGAFELSTIINYLGIIAPDHSVCKFIKGEQPEWWWNKSLMRCMNTNAGFFPPTAEALAKFCEMMLEDAREVDMLGSWQRKECYLQDYLPNRILRADRDNMNPFFAKKPWTRALAGKKVLVVHPFADTIKRQYARREQLFENSDILPDYELKLIKAVQSLGGSDCGFKDWFDALAWMKNEMDKVDYDICLLGCGAYGFPLAAHAKRRGKKAIHIGGSLQLYFGIKGSRWESKGYVDGPNNYSLMFNDYWVRPSSCETPSAARNVENNCYW